MKNYRVFKRTWWKHNPSWPNGLEPEAGEKDYVEDFDTYDEAREFCQYNNANNLPEDNPLSLKYEFEEK